MARRRRTRKKICKNITVQGHRRKVCYVKTRKGARFVKAGPSRRRRRRRRR